MIAATVYALALALAAQTSTSTVPAAPKLTPPVLLELVQAEYPPEALAAGRESTVGLWIEVDATGAVTSVELAESGGPEFDASALAAVKAFRFAPAIAEGIGPVPVRIRYRYRFTLTSVPVRTATIAQTSSAAPPSLARGPINFYGTVLERGVRDPVGLATVSVWPVGTSSEAQSSTITDDRGRFAFRALPAGEYEVRISNPFFETAKEREQLTSDQALEVLYFVTRTERSPYAVTVYGKRQRKEVSRRTIEVEEMRRIPGAQGDAIRVIQNLPGVARTPFGLGLLVVRGAPPQSTGVFLDGHRIPLLFHFGGVGGVTSVINSRALSEINFQPGGFSPEFGRLSGGVIELVTREPVTDRVHGEAQVDFITLVPINVALYLEGPVTSDPSDGSFVFSLRRSSIDGIFALATEITKSSVALAPRYYDYQARYTKPLGDSSRMLSILAYGSDDELVLIGAPDVGANAGGPTGTRSRTYFHRLNPKLTLKGDDVKLTISPIFGVDFTDTVTSGNGPNSSFAVRLSNLSAGGRVDGELKLAPWLKLRVGGDVLYQRFVSDTELPAFTGTKDFPSPIQVDLPTRRDAAKVPALLAAAYVEAELEPIKGLKLWPGLRLDGYDFQADPQFGIDPRLVEGRSSFGLDPRITARWAATDWLSIKGQAGLYREPPLPPQIYLNADLPLQQAQQYSGGVELGLLDRLSLDLTGFYRFAENVPRTTGDVEVVDGKIRPVAFRPNGQQRSYGLELLLKLEKRWGLYGWIAYTLSRSEIRRADGTEDWEANLIFDQTHNLNFVAVYELALNWNLGVRFRYVTGGATNATSFRYYDADADGYRREANQTVRLPPFHQLDVYIEKRWTYDQWYLELYLDVQNVYNATNTEAFIPTFDFKRDVRLPGIPIFPSIGIRGNF
ncbi:MAG: TonB family protein [Myxococcota bacterium]